MRPDAAATAKGTATEEHMDWWAPLGDPGEVRVVQLLDDAAKERVIGKEGPAEVLAATLTVGGQGLSVTGRYKHMAVSSGDDVVAEVDFRPTPQETKFGDWVKPLHLVGEELVLTHGKVKDHGRRARWRTGLRYLSIQGPGRSWVWHFDGGVVAGRRLVLCPGELPGQGEPVVTTVPASAGRGLGQVERHQAVDTHITRWQPAATAAELALVELLTLAGLHHDIDHISSQIAKELGWLPRLAKVEPGE
jgi:hypothetical protein